MFYCQNVEYVWYVLLVLMNDNDIKLINIYFQETTWNIFINWIFLKSSFSCVAYVDANFRFSIILPISLLSPSFLSLNNLAHYNIILPVLISSSPCLYNSPQSLYHFAHPYFIIPPLPLYQSPPPLPWMSDIGINFAKLETTENSGTFKDQISEHFDPVSQNVRKLT